MIFVLPREIEEQLDAFDVEPIPQLAPAHAGSLLHPFRTAQPDGNGNFVAEFACGDWPCVSQGVVKYFDLPPMFLSVDHAMHRIEPGDRLVISLYRGRR